jgi:hypothetical protein
VVAQRNIRWADLGLPEGQQPFGEIAPSASEVNDVWTPLVKFRYRHNSARANVIDATALAHIRRLQNEMKWRGHHHVRVLLVTRARTLLRAAIERAIGGVFRHLWYRSKPIPYGERRIATIGPPRVSSQRQSGADRAARDCAGGTYRGDYMVTMSHKLIYDQFFAVLGKSPV